MPERYTLDEAHSIVRRLPRERIARIHLKPVYGWREILAATFGSPLPVLYEIHSDA